MKSSYKYSKRKPTNFHRVRYKNSNCDMRPLAKECQYPTRPTKEKNCDRRVYDPASGRYKSQPSCDARVISEGSQKKGTNQWVSNLPMLDQIRLYFDRAKVRYGGAIGFRKKYAPYQLDPMNRVRKNNQGFPLVQNPNQFRIGHIEENAYIKSRAAVFKIKPDGQAPPGYGPTPIPGSPGVSWWSNAKRYYYQGEALLKEASRLLWMACLHIEYLFQMIQDYGLDQQPIFAEIASIVSKESLDFFSTVYSALFESEMSLYDFFADMNNSEFWEPLMHQYPSGKERSVPNQHATNFLFDVYNQWSSYFQSHVENIAHMIDPELTAQIPSEWDEQVEQWAQDLPPPEDLENIFQGYVS